MAPLRMTAECDRHLVATQVSSQRMIEWKIEASTQPSTRSPLSLALILDRSGSMQGEKLRAVQQATCHVLDMLDERDRVALIAYDDTIQVIAPGTPVTAQTRETLKRQVNALLPGGWTDLSGGWLEGCRAIAHYQAVDTIDRALLLTDGLANRGITDTEDLTHHARELRKRGIATSTFGVGLDFNEHMLEALATQGGGHFYYIERPAMIADIFKRELGELLTIVAREVFLAIEVPAGVAIEVLGDLPHERDGDRLRIFAGDLFAHEQRYLYTRVLLPPDAVGTSVAVRGELCYANLEQQTVRMPLELAFSYTNENEVRTLKVNEGVLQRSSEVELASAAASALRLEREGQRQQAQGVMRQALAAASAYAPAPATARYQSFTEQLAEGLDEQQRKNAQFETYRKRHSRS